MSEWEGRRKGGPFQREGGTSGQKRGRLLSGSSGKFPPNGGIPPSPRLLTFRGREIWAGSVLLLVVRSDTFARSKGCELCQNFSAAPPVWSGSQLGLSPALPLQSRPRRGVRTHHAHISASLALLAGLPRFAALRPCRAGAFDHRSCTDTGAPRPGFVCPSLHGASHVCADRLQ